MSETSDIRLTQFSHGAGCGCKLAPGALADAVAHLTPRHDPDLMVGLDTGDDAAVWRLDDHRALVSTVDFITPVVDDARTWGRVAAANAVSDIYAMGGRPLFALNLVCWNADELGPDLLTQLILGGSDIAEEAGFLIVGGHSVVDPEPKYGLSVVGEIDPNRVLTNTGLEPDQDIILTKALGVGIVTTAIKAGAATDDAIAAAVESMCLLNKHGSEVALLAGATGCTDVTGFGLFGHLGRMTLESKVDAALDVDSVPHLPGAAELAADGFISGGTRRNLDWMRDRVDPGGHDELTLLRLADAQTSGGLVFGVPHGESARAVKQLSEIYPYAAVIGRTTEGSGRIHLN